ncbi:hypothetical protein ITX54_01415 [Rouxiella silvae]|uniref:Uncharacterized protein n=1 Tax=Rouxiella silvae TaxID=1646373 RepID=A0AA40WY83_9GAMM|nr:hypothetical protein [Rouxiella silvae]MBF6635330.1 hypothetical protein [Rouxiella silvae]
MNNQPVSQHYIVSPALITAVKVITLPQNIVVVPTVLMVVNNPAQPASTSGESGFSTAVNLPGNNTFNRAEFFSRAECISRQQIEAAKLATPRLPLQTGSEYVTALVNAPGGDRLSAKQLADAADVSRYTVGHIIEIRGETKGTTSLREIKRDEGETDLKYGRRLKLLRPNYSNDDYVAVSGAARTTLLDYPEFQPDTPKVASLRTKPEAEQREHESVKDWGLRLMTEYKLAPAECARYCDQKVGIFRSLSLKRTAGQASDPKKAVKAQQAAHVFTKPDLPAPVLINIATAPNLTMAMKAPNNFPAADVPQATIDLSDIEYANFTPIGSPAPVQSPLSPPPLASSSHERAYLLQEANQINSLLNAADFPPTRFITVQGNDATINTYRRVNMPISSSANPHNEIRLMRTNLPTGSATQAYYELCDGAYRVPNRHDAESLYRALAQYEVLQVSAIPIAQLDPDTVTPGENNSKNEEENNREHEAAQLGADARMSVVETIRRYKEMAGNALMAQPAMTTHITRVDDSPEGIASLSSSISSLSVEERAPAAKKAKLRQMIWKAEPEKLPGLLIELEKVTAKSPAEVLNWISSEQLMEHAVLAVLSGKAHHTGSRVMRDTAKALFNILATQSELLHQVYNTLFPNNRELGLRFVNTIPLVIHSTTGVVITQLLKKLCENSEVRREIKEFFKEKYVADREMSEEYSLGSNFYGRLGIMSREMAPANNSLEERKRKNKEDSIEGGVQQADNWKSNLSISLETLRESGLSRRTSFWRTLTHKKLFNKPTAEEQARQRNNLARIMYEHVLPMSEDRIQRLLQLDLEKYTRWETNTNAFRASGRKLHDEQQKVRAQKRLESFAATALASTSLAIHGQRRAAARNAEKYLEQDALKNRQWQEDRTVRDVANETLRLRSPNFIAAAAGAAINASMGELQSRVRPSAASIHSLIREGHALQENEKMKSKISSPQSVVLNEEASIDLPYSPLTRPCSVSSQLEGHINEVVDRSEFAREEDIPSIHLSNFDSDIDNSLWTPDSEATELYDQADLMSDDTIIYSLDDSMKSRESINEFNLGFNETLDRTIGLLDRFNNTLDAELPAIEVDQQEVDALLTRYIEENDLNLRISLPNTPLHEPGVDEFSLENIELQTIEK